MTATDATTTDPWGGALTGPYGCIVADPPWAYPITQRLAGKNRRRTGAGSYSRMTVAEIAAFPVAALAADAAHLWLWTTTTGLLQGWHRTVADAWGFRAVSLLTWCKPGPPGLGTYLRSNTEHCVFAVRGWGTVPDLPARSTWHVWPRGPHSEKPAAFGDLAEQVSPGPYVELFARQQRLGWDAWGDGYEGRARS